MPEEHRKWVGADNSPALFRENDINGSALRSVDDVRAQLLDHAVFGITSASCGRDPAQVVKAVVSSFATTRGGTPGGPPEGGGLAAGLSPLDERRRATAQSWSSTGSCRCCVSTYTMSSRSTKPGCSAAPAYFCASDSEALTAQKRGTDAV